MATVNKNLAQPANSSLNWDVPLNKNFFLIDQAVAGTQTLNLTSFAGGDIVLTNNTTLPNTGGLTDASYIPMRIIATGTMGANANIVIPAGISGMWVLGNYTTGAYTLTFKGTGGSTSVVLPKSAALLVFCDGANVGVVGSSAQTFMLPQIGDIKQSASEWAQTGWIICDGREVSRTTYADLFARIGGRYGSGNGSTTFNVPDCRGRVIASATDMGITGNSGRLNNYGIGAAGGDQFSYLSDASQNAPHQHWDYGHGHAADQDTHAHGYTIVTGGTGIGYGAGFQLADAATGAAHPGTYVGTGYANISATGSGAAHANIQPTIAMYTFIYAGV